MLVVGLAMGVFYSDHSFVQATCFVLTIIIAIALIYAFFDFSTTWYFSVIGLILQVIGLMAGRSMNRYKQS